MLLPLLPILVRVMSMLTHHHQSKNATMAATMAIMAAGITNANAVNHLFVVAMT